MKKIVLSPAYGRRLFTTFVVISAVLGSIFGFFNQVNLLPFVKIFLGGLGGALFGFIAFFCVLGFLVEYCQKE
jgi:membrane associated rhomboid family serine protease